jgi:hypothetical protein
MSLWFDENECFDVRLHQSQIDLITNALKLLQKKNDDEEIDLLIECFENVEKKSLNSFVD